MTRQKTFKERIRARMDKTGESYTSARRHLIERSEAESRKRRTPKTIAATKTSDVSVRENTGRTRTEWFKLLDRWGATNKKHPEIARWLTGEQGVDGWWAQHLTVAYEQERGMRAPGQRADGTYSISASKTVNVHVNKLFEAFHDGSTREKWLGEVDLEIRTARPGKSLTARWEGGDTRITVGFTDKGAHKSQVAMAHERVPDAQQADELKLFWRGRMKILKELLES